MASRTQGTVLREDTSGRYTQQVVFVQPGAEPEVPEGLEMGRVSQVVLCDKCGFKGQSRLAYIRGMWAYMMCCCFWATWQVPYSLMCLLGEPFWVKRACWDIEHFCVKCGQKVGYSVLCAECFCLYSAAYNYPKEVQIQGL